MKPKLNLIIYGIIIVITFLIGIVLYPKMPEIMASHWNAQGEVNGHISKFWGLFLMPIISLILLIIYIIIPKIDPLKSNIVTFRKQFDKFILIILFFLLYLHILTLIWNIKGPFNLTVYMIPALAIVFFYAGILIEKSKQNWFIGIRTPWTLSSEVVWDKTNKLGGKLFKISAIIMIFGMLFPQYLLLFVLIPLLFSAIYLITYSYLEFKKLK